MTDHQLHAYFEAEYQKPFLGWDFSYIQDRMIEEPITWGYENIVLKETRNIENLLDMGTGGGEFLSSLQPLPLHTFATEGYEPNIKIAKARLEPLGVSVYGIESDENLPLETGCFDLVINRHESYSETEVHRILKTGARFITQQVGGENDLELNRILGDHSIGPYAHWNLSYAVNSLKEHGFKILEQKEEYPRIEFKDVGAVIYYLKAIPWQVQGFSIQTHFEGLKNIKGQIDQDGSFRINAHRFLIIAEKQ